MTSLTESSPPSHHHLISRLPEWGRHHPGSLALLSLALASWTLILLARFGWFGVAPIASLFLIAAAIAGGISLWQARRPDVVAFALLVLVSVLLYTPPAQHIALSGDAAIYPNDGAYIARTGGVSGVYEPFAHLSPAARNLFFVSTEEQFDGLFTVQSYDGIVYGDYYLVGDEPVRAHVARMPLAEVWYALLIKMFGLTPAFYLNAVSAALALLLLYATGTQINGSGVALWSALLLAVCYPQVHFSRASYAEIVGQLWTLAGLLYAVFWLRQHQPWQLVLAIFFWVTTWATRADGLLLFGAIALLLLVAGYDRDSRSLRAALFSLPLLAVLGWLGHNPVYFGATLELFGDSLRVFSQMLVALLVLLPVAIWTAWHWGRQIVQRLQPILPVVYAAIFLLCFFVVAWATLPNPMRELDVTRPFQEIIWFSSRYVSPLFYWLALAGVGVVLWGRFDRARFFITATFLGLGFIFFYRYSSAPGYPVSLRRLVGDVFPLMALLSGVALAAIPFQGRWRLARAGIAVATLLWIGWLASPVIQQREAFDDVRFIQELHQILPDDAVLIFEKQDHDSWVGWLAAPLYSIHADWALLLDSDAPDPALLAQAVAAFEDLGRPVYVISQHEPLPESLTPPGYIASPAFQLTWHSSLIGQTREPYPPPYWEFAHPVNVHLLSTDQASSQ